MLSPVESNRPPHPYQSKKKLFFVPIALVLLLIGLAVISCSRQPQPQNAYPTAGRLVITQQFRPTATRIPIDHKAEKEHIATLHAAHAATPQPPGLPGVEQLSAQVNLERMLADLTWLAADARQGRLAGTPSEDEVGQWLVERMVALGLQPFADAGFDQYLQPFDSAIPGQQAENVIAVIPSGQQPPAGYLIIGAHYDHIGVSPQGHVYNGADDDASGVIAVLETARILSESGISPRASIVFVLFSSEESGLLGSEAFARQLSEAGLVEKSAFINLEMLGAVKGTDTFIDLWDQDNTISDPLAEVVLAAGQQMSIPIQHLGVDPGSDAWQMLAYGIPSITLSTAWEDGANHPYYHSPADDVENIEPQGLLDAAKIILASAWRIAYDTP